MHNFGRKHGRSVMNHRILSTAISGQSGWTSRPACLVIEFDLSQRKFSVCSMQLTIEIPERLGQRLEPERGHLAEIIELGLRLRQWANESVLAQEVIGFLARGPQPEEIVGFRPAAAAVARSWELLYRNGDTDRSLRRQRRRLRLPLSALRTLAPPQSGAVGGWGSAA